MSRTVKALLLSALVFPGTGYFVLKKPVRGLLLILIAAACVYFVFSNTMEIAQTLSAEIQRGEIPMEIDSIVLEVSTRLAGNEGSKFNAPMWVFLICWFVGVIDAIRLGSKQDADVQ